MVIDSKFYMNLALQEAWKYQGLTYPNPAVGCCVVGEHGEILAINAHQKAGQPHAEVMALKDAYYKLTSDENIIALENSANIHRYLIENHNNLFLNCSLYTTLEPCSHIGKTLSCANLISSLQIKSVYVGAIDLNEEASRGNEILEAAKISVSNNILQKRAKDLLEPFEKFRKDNFVFFKWAQRLNGSVDEGVISSHESRKHVHAMRDVCDLLVVGGETVRQDRPTLDARLVNGKAPDILIYSRSDDFDKTIPLFSVANREVFIEKSLSKIKEYKNIMIEGGEKMYQLTRDEVDYYLCYIAPKFGGSKASFVNLEDEFEILHSEEKSQDIILWMKRKQ
jgi:diaminohydroxyphosphoribosylaminopyrimidine deaminase/5-amino-6-(5-phosphoribosylamino)uracil reductase